MSEKRQTTGSINSRCRPAPTWPAFILCILFIAFGRTVVSSFEENSSNRFPALTCLRPRSNVSGDVRARADEMSPKLLGHFRRGLFVSLQRSLAFLNYRPMAFDFLYVARVLVVLRERHQRFTQAKHLF